MAADNNSQLVKKKRPVSRISRGTGIVFDVMTLIFISASVLLLGMTLLIIANPDSELNPFPATPLPTLFQSPTPTITFTPSATATATSTPLPPTATATFTPVPSSTPTATGTYTPTPVIPGLEPATPATGGDRDPSVVQGVQGNNSPFDPNAPFPFVLLTVRYEANTRVSGCNWASIAGNITGVGGEPITDITVEVIGDDFEFTTFSGREPLFGASGFEIEIGTQPFLDTYDIRLYGPNREALSDVTIIDTGTGCESNITVLEFVQVADY